MDRINAIDSDTRRFLRHLRTWVDSHKRELSEIEEAHVASVQQSLQTVRATKAEIEETKTAVEELIGTIDTQQQELKKLQESLAEDRERRRKQQQSLATLTAEIDQAKHAIERLEKVHQADQAVLDEQQARVLPELELLQRLLSIRIDTVQEDILQVKFTNVDAANHAREFSLLVDVSQDDYRVPSSKPMVPALPSLVNTLNRDRDFFKFIKHARVAFVEYARDERG